MSQSRTMLLAVIMGVTAWSLTYETTGNDVLSVAAAILGGLIAVLGVWYSPYPDATHNFGMGVKRQKWGFTSEQDGDKWIHEPVNRNEGDSE